MKVVRWSLLPVLVILLTVSATGQTLNAPQRDITSLQEEITSLERQKKTGVYMAGGGMALQFLSLALVPSPDLNSRTGAVSEGSWVPFYLVLGGGTLLGIVGGYKWWDASQQLGPLKAKRYDLGIVPTWDYERANAGIALVLHF